MHGYYENEIFNCRNYDYDYDIIIIMRCKYDANSILCLALSNSDQKLC